MALMSYLSLIHILVLPEDFSTFSSVGVLKNLDSYIRDDSSFDKTSYYKASYDAGAYKQHQYALPYESVPTLMLSLIHILLAFEIGYDQGEAVKRLMEAQDFSCVEIKKDLARLDRLVFGFAREGE